MTSSETPDQTEVAAAPATIPFSELGLSDAVLKSLKDVVGLAQTGTGKTAAFALPTLPLGSLSEEPASFGACPHA